MKLRPRHLIFPADTTLFKKVLTLALPGARNTKYPAVVEMVIAWLFFLPTCYITAVKLNSGIVGSWISFGLYIALYATAIAWKVFRGDWKKIEV